MECPSTTSAQSQLVFACLRINEWQRASRLRRFMSCRDRATSTATTDRDTLALADVALLSVLSFTHNHDLTGSQRLSRQFDAAQRLAAAIPIRTLAYPRILASLDNVKDTILDDLRHHVDTV
jgi:hypothetical protein